MPTRFLVPVVGAITTDPEMKSAQDPLPRHTHTHTHQTRHDNKSPTHRTYNKNTADQTGKPEKKRRAQRYNHENPNTHIHRRKYIERTIDTYTHSLRLFENLDFAMIVQRDLLKS